MLNKKSLSSLKEGKNLLAFSGGVDSSALFFLLQRQNILFDIAIVNYQMREQAAEEIAYAQSLAKSYDKECYLLEVTLEKANFEAQARKVRYDFFETLVQQYHYDHLITAHQLDDRLEWLLMQLSKGAGLHELLGMQTIEKRPNYLMVRPLVETTKATLLTYLQTEEIPYFLDQSNQDTHYKRNFFRRHIAAPLLEDYAQGIKNSFNFLQEDLEALRGQQPVLQQTNQLYYFKQAHSRRSSLILIDKILKANGFLMRQGDKEALKSSDEHVVGRRFVVTFSNFHIFIAPYVEHTMTKAFREQCRLLKIPQKLRPYLCQDSEAFEAVVTLLKEC